MVKLLALLALASLSLVSAAPTPAEESGTVATVYRTKEEALALMADEQLQSRSEPATEAGLDPRQVPSFGAYWENWDFQGASFYHRANIDNKGYYIGNDWNDRISSIWNYDQDKQCSYWTNWDSGNGGYCWGDGLVLTGRVSHSRLYAPFNDAISCRVCKWN